MARNPSSSDAGTAARTAGRRRFSLRPLRGPNLSARTSRPHGAGPGAEARKKKTAQVEPAPGDTRRLSPWLRRLGDYGLALLFVAVATLLRWALPDVLKPTPILVFYLAWVGAAAFGGLGPGLLATVASWLCIELLFEPPLGQIDFTDLTSIGRLVILLAGGLVVSVVGEKMRRSRIRERQQRRALGVVNAQLQAKTEELLAANEELREREQALRESEARFRILTANLSSGVALIDESGKFALYNPAFLALFGLAEHSSIKNVNDRNWADWQVFEADGTLLPVADHPVRKAALTGRAVRNKLVGVRSPLGGALRWMLISAEPIPRADGRRAIICTYHDITEQKAAEEALRELNATLESRVAERTEELQQRAQQLQRLTLELSEAEERERERLAQILHDDLQQILAAAKFQVGLLEGGRRGRDEAQEILGHVKEMLKDAIEKSRSLSHELSPVVLHRGDLVETFDRLAEQMQAQHGLTVRVQAGGAVQAHSDVVKTLLYRAAQEMLFNVSKHARVHEARLRIRRRGRYLCLSVSDRGRGFDPQEIRKTAGFGLWSIRERVVLLGGRMRTRSAKGRGTTLRIIMPDAESSPAARQWKPTEQEPTGRAAPDQPR